MNKFSIPEQYIGLMAERSEIIRTRTTPSDLVL